MRAVVSMIGSFPLDNTVTKAGKQFLAEAQPLLKEWYATGEVSGGWTG